MIMLTESETAINQNATHIYNAINFIQNIFPDMSTTQNNMNPLFGISQFNDQLHTFLSLGDLAFNSTYSPIPKLKGQLHIDTFQSKLESDIIEEEKLTQANFYVESFQNSMTFSESDKKMYNTGFDFDDLLKLSPIVQQNDLVPKGEKYSLRQTIPKPRLEDILLNMPQKFDTSDISKLKRFIFTPKILEIPNLPERLDKIICHVSSFIHKLGYDGKSKIDVFSDEEIENFQSITIEYFVKNATSDQCIKWTESLVSEIITIDENMLNIVQVEIIPDGV